MLKISTVEARENFAEIINQAAYGKQRVILTRRGRELVAVIPLEDLNRLEAFEQNIDAKTLIAAANKRITEQKRQQQSHEAANE